MKVLKSTLLLMSVIFMVLSIQSCKDACEDVECENGGTCLEGYCECPIGYVGTNCQNFNPNQIQTFLNNGSTPLALYNEGITLDQLYGLEYLGGFIFYLKTDDGTGMVAATEDQSTGAEWGCFEIDIMDLDNVTLISGSPNGSGAEIGDGSDNTDKIINANCISSDGSEIAAKLCRNKGVEWFLPSMKELDLMYSNLSSKGHGGFQNAVYWSSSEINESIVWFKVLNNGGQSSRDKNTLLHVRAARAF